ncbi:DUF934 domain-containing protein [Paraburkholderia sp. J67]|uniref:DUF934 domain-containing protein n=1 Tax=Paraburkholderia sp. J67 TaxID=2805435 RepID=UPI002ABD8667|nr:DUF934 domain-containing protein [Paraburkholderia sp. J67]
MKPRIRLLSARDHAVDTGDAILALPNDADPLAHALAIANAVRVELHFPAFTDGRAFSQAYLVRRRLGFKGDLRATGDVLADQLLQMERTGFSSAVLAEGVDRDEAQRQLERFESFYQADALNTAPWRKAPHNGD